MENLLHRQVTAKEAKSHSVILKKSFLIRLLNHF
ncbi:hypothetical protein SAMN04488541_100610 [Thermoflexibacter ruber]|uniref:Uncharacterized protein n=1 Tax=Thermoflexibacter ruber TaxID=1003 RepID=A0A1I2D0U6_9BACT|nr:hypothetical protein SAMN04488541_100610 [Thermoflexibacter ruber]